MHLTVSRLLPPSLSLPTARRDFLAAVRSAFYKTMWQQRPLCLIALLAASADAWHATPTHALWQRPWQRPWQPQQRCTAAQLNFFDSLFGSSPPSPPAVMSREESIAQAAKLGVQLPQYEVLRSGSGFEVRRYQRLQVVECIYVYDCHKLRKACLYAYKKRTK